MEKSYWSSVLAKRQLTRRRLLSGAVGIAAGGAALSLIGCGGGDEGGIKGDASGLLEVVQDTTKNAKAGGTWPSSFAEEIINMDPLLNNATPTFPQLLPVYSNLLKGGVNVVSKGRPGPEAITGDAAESWEITPDGTQITLKLRQNMKFDPRPPTSGRVMDSSDVKWSWDKFASQGPSAADFANSRNDAAPIQSLTTPDARTVVMKMAFPYGPITELLQSSQHFYVMPKDDNFNFRGDMRGSGPYFLDNYRPSAGITYKKNPDWYDKPRPFFDVIERTLVSDYAQGLAQFRSKNLWTFGVRPEDILQTKQENPAMTMVQNTEFATGVSYVNYSKRPDSVFNDVRIRRALSMTLDRELLGETFDSLDRFKAAGLPVQSVWNSHIPAGYPEWIDPKGTGLGEGAKYFQYNIAEAKKLIEAAGVKTPIKETYGSWTDRAFDTVKQHEVTMAMMNDSGLFQFEWRPLIYNTTWRTEDDSGGTAYTGLLSSRLAGFSVDVYVVQKYTPTGRSKVSGQPVPGVTDLVLKQRVEPDARKRAAIIADLQKAAALEWPDIPAPPTSFPGFSLRWPWLANHGAFNTGNATARDFTYYWYDESKKV
jgi:ABC-type transport system substrate-binding protein